MSGKDKCRGSILFGILWRKKNKNDFWPKRSFATFCHEQPYIKYFNVTHLQTGLINTTWVIHMLVHGFLKIWKFAIPRLWFVICCSRLVFSRAGSSLNVYGEIKFQWFSDPRGHYGVCKYSLSVRQNVRSIQSKMYHHYLFISLNQVFWVLLVRTHPNLEDRK